MKSTASPSSSMRQTLTGDAVSWGDYLLLLNRFFVFLQTRYKPSGSRKHNGGTNEEHSTSFILNEANFNRRCGVTGSQTSDYFLVLKRFLILL